MLFYVRCPTCGRVISSHLDKYTDDFNDIKNNNSLSKNEKELKVSKLLDKYGFKSICCRIRIMGTLPYHEIIKS